MVGDDYRASSGKPACAWNDPIARDELVTRLVNDALAILALSTVSNSTTTSHSWSVCSRWSPAKTSNPASTEGRWRIERSVAQHRVISTVDPETRHMHKSRSSYRDGYKAHIAVEPDDRADHRVRPDPGQRR